MATAKERAFKKTVKTLIKNANALADQAAARVIKLLESARRDVAATVGSTEWQLYRLTQMQAAIERALDSFAGQYGMTLTDTQRQFWTKGIEMVDLPLRTVGIAAALPEIDITALSIMQGYSSDLVTNLSQSAVRKINTELTLGLMGQKSPYDVMQAVGKSLKNKSIFKSIAARADVITRTELGRVYEMAGQARKIAAATVVPGLQKQWFYGHSPRMPRLSHLAADGQVRDVDEPFDVGGEKLMYPRDPAGSAANTIKCG